MEEVRKGGRTRAGGARDEGKRGREHKALPLDALQPNLERWHYYSVAAMDISKRIITVRTAMKMEVGCGRFKKAR